MRAFVHDVVNPIAAIRISLGALQARGALSERELSDIGRIEEAAGEIVRLVTNLGPLPERPGLPLADPTPAPVVDLHVLCCELAERRRFSDGTIIHCRAFGDPRGEWDRVQVTKLVSALLDHAVAHVGNRASLTVSVTGLARHVRVDVHGLGLVGAPKRRTSLEVVSQLGGSLAGTNVSAIASPNGGIVFRFRLPRRRPAPGGGAPKIASRLENP
ncbi:MAG TPA: hypothetical protein VKZ18_24920 [Polyangia bacterium]|nr:hypothetical protein [Polyangia bacterium]